MNFYYHAESDYYLADKKDWIDDCTPVTPEQYFAAMHPKLYGYDIETYFNVFTVTIMRPSDRAIWRFEISPRINQGVEFFQLLTQIKDSGGKMVGYNSVGFDYPVIHELVKKGGHITAHELFIKCDEIVNGDWDNRFVHMIRESDWYVPQIDVFKIHHFDNVSRSTSLKMLEFNMMSQNIQDLPFKPGTSLTGDQIAELVPYNDHDVFETIKFLYETVPMLEFRNELSEKYGRNFTNHNDTKIGKDYFIMELERMGIPCYHKPNGRREPRQTKRPSIALNSVIFPWIQFSQPGFQRVMSWLQAQTIIETKGIFKELNCVIDGFQYDFGTGGIHGSVASQIVSSDAECDLWDWDVKSYYPKLAISNRLYPEHLGEQFCDIYEDVYDQRQTAKDAGQDDIQKMLKLALNGVYGDSNNKYSPFFDPAYTMAITINGQLLLCLLAEYLITIPGLSLVQVNTDGLTIRCPRSQTESMQFICKTWEQLTGLELESVQYSRMMIRDVNNYIAECTDGKLKRKGAYCYGEDLSWHQNYSCQIVAMAAEAALIHGAPVDQTVRACTDPMMFMKRTKVPRSSRLMLETGEHAEQLQNITRYYVSTNGGALTKIMPPTPAQVKKAAANTVRVMVKDGHEPHTSNDESSYWNLIQAGYAYSHDEICEAPERRIGIDVGWTVTPCNNLDEHTVSAINYDYYIKEAEKLVNPLTQGTMK